MSDKPFFSVIVPAYNSAGHITKLLDSIKAQSFTDYELIVVCDSCDDNTADVARSYGANVLEVNYHLDGLTRNAGLDVATGEWVLFADDDDWFIHEYCFKQIADIVGKHGEDAIVFSYIWKGHGYYRQTPENLSVQVWSKCWRRSFIGNTRFSFRHYWSDCDFHNKIMRKPHKFVYWDMLIYYYNFERKNSQTKLVMDNEAKHYTAHPSRVLLYDTSIRS